MLSVAHLHTQLASILNAILLFSPTVHPMSADGIEKEIYAFFVGVAWTLFFLFQAYTLLNKRDVFYRWINVTSIGMVSFWTLKWFFVVLADWTHGPIYDILLLVGEKLLVLGLVGSVYSYLGQEKPRQFILIIGLATIGVLISIASIWVKHQALISIGNSFSAVILFYSLLNTLFISYKRACAGALFLAGGLLVAFGLAGLIAYNLSQQAEFGVYLKFPLWITISSRLIYIIMPVFMLARYNTNTKQQLNQKQAELTILLNEKRLTLEQQNEQLEQEVAKQTSELRISNAIKDRMFSVVSHDLRSPIASLKDTLARVQQQHLSPADFQPLLLRLTQHVDRLYDNLDNLLYWSLAQMNELQLRLAPQSVRELIDDVLELAGEMASNKQIVITIDVPDNVMVMADEFQLRIILRNLIDNALKFSLPGGHVSIKSSLDGDQAVISINDKGVGISSERMALLFADIPSSSGTAGERGTGLGLRLSRQLTERNGGTIMALSQPGIGTHIQVILPVAEFVSDAPFYSDEPMVAIH